MSAHAEPPVPARDAEAFSQAGRTPHLGRGGRGGAGRPRRRDGARRRAAGARRPLGAAARRRSAVRRRRARRAGWRGPPHRARAARAGGRGAPRRDRDRGCRGCCHRRRLSDRRTADAPPRAACPVPGQCAHGAHRDGMGDVHIRHVGAAEAGGPQPRRADRRDQAGAPRTQPRRCGAPSTTSAATAACRSCCAPSWAKARWRSPRPPSRCRRSWRGSARLGVTHLTGTPSHWRRVLMTPEATRSRAELRAPLRRDRRPGGARRAEGALPGRAGRPRLRLHRGRRRLRGERRPGRLPGRLRRTGRARWRCASRTARCSCARPGPPPATSGGRRACGRRRLRRHRRHGRAARRPLPLRRPPRRGHQCGRPEGASGGDRGGDQPPSGRAHVAGLGQAQPDHRRDRRRRGGAERSEPPTKRPRGRIS